MRASVDVVVPVFNEVATVAELHDRLLAACPGAHVVYVDNGSTDGTLALVERLPSATVVRHESNLGYGRSLLDGIAASHGDLVVMIDADLEYHPEDVPRLIQALQFCPCVYGSRFLPGGAQGEVMPLFRRVGNRVVTSLFNVLFHQTLTDLYTGLRGVRRDAIPPELSCDGFELVLELAARISASGVHIGEVPVGYTARTRGQSKMRHVPEFLRFARRLVGLRVETALAAHGAGRRPRASAGVA